MNAKQRRVARRELTKKFPVGAWVASKYRPSPIPFSVVRISKPGEVVGLILSHPNYSGVFNAKPRQCTIVEKKQ